jgi:bifunctional DNA-binding transcriptional regulator/antitoxin component of YhaV-PrlF toxin-antitoxin module
MDIYKLPVGKRGVITLPKEARVQSGITEKTIMTMLDLDGVFILAPHKLQTDILADRLAKKLMAKGETLKSTLKTLEEIRVEEQEWLNGRPTGRELL